MNSHNLSAIARARSPLIAIALGCAMSWSVAAPSDTASPSQARAGIFKSVEGDVTVIRGEQHTRPKVGDTVSQADRIVTAKRSGAALTLTDGSVLTVGAESSLTLDTVQYEPVSENGNIVLQMLQGSLRMITGKIAKNQPENVKVGTPTAVIGVRGTDFIVDVTP